MARKILLADDSVTIQKVVELTFMDQDCDVTSVGDGDAALSALRVRRPDLVIADVHMPGADGYAVCRFAKATYPGLPVLLLVGTFEAFEEADVVSCGADGHLRKPFEGSMLLSEAEHLLAAAAASAPAAASPSAVEELSAIDDSWAVADAVVEAEPVVESWDALPDLEPEPLAPVVEDFYRPPVSPSPWEVPVAAADPEPPAVAAPRVPAFWPEPAAAVAAPVVAPLPTFAPAVVEPPPFRTPAYEAPSYEAPAFAAPAYEPPAYEPPAYEPPAYEPPAYEPPAYEPPAAESVAAEDEPAVDMGSAEEELVERIARRVVELMSEKLVRQVAWDVIPDLAEVVIRDRIRELEAELEG